MSLSDMSQALKIYLNIPFTKKSSKSSQKRRNKRPFTKKWEKRVAYNKNNATTL